MLNQALDAVVPLCALLIFGYISYNFYKWVLTRQITGKPNEWVVIMKNGEFVNAGIGISHFKMPFEEVAVFPSKVNKIQFTTDQITKEMQGLRVSAMLVWTVYRENPGPMKAYMSLGEDLVSDEPTMANNLLISMSSAIVRNCIANSTIDEVLKSRDLMRDQIKKKLTPIVTGWGVYLETVEIIDVKISSGSLFTNMQCKFREDQNREATVQKMEVDHTIRLEKEKHALTTCKRENDTLKVKSLATSN